MFFREGFGQAKLPSWDRRGGAKRRGGTSQMRAKRAFLSIRRRRYAPHFFSTTPLASFLGSLPLLSQEGSFEFRPSTRREAETQTQRVFQRLAVVYFGQVCLFQE